jgi:hypothetical protein
MPTGSALVLIPTDLARCRIADDRRSPGFKPTNMPTSKERDEKRGSFISGRAARRRSKSLDQ